MVIAHIAQAAWTLFQETLTMVYRDEPLSVVSLAFSLMASSPLSPFFKALQQGDAKTLEKALQGDPQLLREPLPSSLTSLASEQFNGGQRDNFALLYALKHGRLGCVKVLFPHTHSKCFAGDQSTPLMVAAAHGHASCVEFLLPLCDPQVLNDAGWNALDLAVFEKHTACAVLLAQHIDPNRFLSTGSNALLMAARFGRLDLLEGLLPLCDPKRQAPIVSGSPFSQTTALIQASTVGFVQGVERLLPLSELEAMDSTGRTAFMHALEQKDSAIAELFLRHAPRATLATTCSKDGRTPLMFAASTQYRTPDWISRHLLSLGDPLITDARGNSALFYAAGSAHLEVVKLLLPHSHPQTLNAVGESAARRAFNGYQSHGPRYGHLACLDALAGFEPVEQLQQMFRFIEPEHRTQTPHLLACLEKKALHDALRESKSTLPSPEAKGKPRTTRKLQTVSEEAASATTRHSAQSPSALSAKVSRNRRRI